MAGKISSIILGGLFWCLLLGIAIAYQVEHGNWVQAVAGAILTVAVLCAMFLATKDSAKGRDSDRGGYSVGPDASKRTIGTKLLIGVCTVATFVGWALPNNWYVNKGTVGASGVLLHHEWWRLITSAFLHATPMHLWMNMAALWYLGSEIETLLGTRRFLAVYAAAALGGGLTVVALGQEHTLGASGAIYGLMGASLFFGWNAWKHGYRGAAKRLLIASGILVGVNFLFTMAIPNISWAAHLGGLVTGFFAAMIVGVPSPLKLAWALTDTSPPKTYYTCDAAGTLHYHGPLRFALEAQFVSPGDLATAVNKDAWPQYLQVAHADPDDMIISCPVPSEKLPSSPMRFQIET